MRHVIFCCMALTMFCPPALAAETDGLFFSIGGLHGKGPDGQKREAEFGVIAVSKYGKKWQTVFRGGMVTKDFSHANNNMIRGITFGEGRYVAAGNPGAGIMVSDDGRNWRHVTKLGDRLGGFNIAYGNGIFLIARAGDMLRSEDGITWTRHKTPVQGRKTWGKGGLGHMRQVAFGNGRFVCLGDNRIAVTRDGKKYDHVAFHSEERRKGRQTILFGAGRFLWLRTQGHSTSKDGIRWQPLEITENATDRQRTGQAIGTVWTGHQFVSGAKNALFVSKDGLKWTRIDAQGYIRPRASGNGVLVGKATVSTNGGKTWQKTEPGVPQREIVFLPETQKQTRD